MSQIKIDQQETIRTTTQQQNGGGRGGPRDYAPPPRKEGLVHEVGDALTAGAGPGGYLAVSTTNTALA